MSPLPLYRATRLRLAAAVVLVLVSATTAPAQAPRMPKVAAQDSQPFAETVAVEEEPFQYIFFWKRDDPHERNMLQVFRAATKQMGSTVTTSVVNINDPQQRQIVAQYDVSRAPMPLVLCIAPNGAVAKAFPIKFTAEQLREGLISPHAAQCLKALQDKKLVVLCVMNTRTPVSQAVHQSALQFQTDPRFAAATEVIAIDSDDAADATFLRQLQIAPRATDVITVVMAPPGQQVAKFTGKVTKEQLVSKVTAAQTGCCPGGKCGPGGCCPGGKCSPQSNTGAVRKGPQ